MPKIAMIGAGSLVFCQTLTSDILATEALRDSEICLMSRTKAKLDRMEAFVNRMIQENGLRRVGREASGDRRQRQHHRHVRIRQHERQTLGRILRVERHIRAAGFENAE